MKYGLIAKLVLALIFVLVFTHFLWFDKFLLDGLHGLLNGLLGEDTYYSEGYSDAAFRKLRQGMTKDQVYSLLGEPLSRYPVHGGREGWRYSGKRTDTHYRIRVVLFRGERVDEIMTGFYVD